MYNSYLRFLNVMLFLFLRLKFGLGLLTFNHAVHCFAGSSVFVFFIISFSCHFFSSVMWDYLHLDYSNILGNRYQCI